MHSYKSNRGSVLIVALIFAVIIAISLTSYLKLSLNAGKLANRTFHLNAAQNLVDTGFERTLWCLNNAKLYGSPANWTTGGFAARTGFSNEYQATLPTASTYYSLSGGAQGQVKVWAAYDTTTKLWHTVAQGIITLGDGTTLSKTAETYMRQRSYFNKGIVARNGMQFNGSTRVDSWDSNSDTEAPGDDVLYSTGVAHTEAEVASPSLVSLQNADIYGWASIGTDDATGISVGASGKLAGSFTAGNGIDLTRLDYDFTASFPDVDAPTNSGLTLGTALSAITAATVLPRVDGAGLPLSADKNADGNYYYYVPSITLSAGADTIVIGPTTIDASHPAAKVVLVVPGDITMSGTSQLVINSKSSLTIYAASNFEMGGSSGIQNGTGSVPNNPVNFTLLGTRSEAQIAAGQSMQVINIQGNGYLSAVINAPNGNLTVNGTGDGYGSLMGNRVTMVGNGGFHQDESLQRIYNSSLWEVGKWRELSTETERGTYATQLAF
jgi:hypothetical protein